MVEIFKDDFENAFAPWDGAVADTGCVIETSVENVRLGTFSAHMKNRETDLRGQAYCHKSFPTQNIVHHRFYVYINADSGSSYAFLGGFSQYVPSVNAGIGITGANRNLFLRYVDAAGSHYVTSSVSLALKKQYCIEIGVNKDLGEIRVWLNGSEVADLTRTGLDLSGQNYNHVVNGVLDAYRFVDCFQDAVVVADSYIGPLPELPRNATLTGKVTDKRTGAPIAAAAVNATNVYTGEKFTAASDDSGVYSITVPCDTYDLQASAESYEPSEVVRIEALEEKTYTVNFELKAFLPTQRFVETDFSSGSLYPYTPVWMEGVYDFFTPATDPLGTGAYGVIFKNGRIAGRYVFTQGLGFIRATQTVAFPNTAALNGFLILRTKAMLGTPNFLFWLDVWNNRWRTIYYHDGSMVFGDYPKIAPPEPNRKYKVTLELKMGAGDGEARLYIDDDLVWERLGLNNIGAGSAIELIEIGLPIYGEGAVCYFYNSIVDGTVLPVHTLSGYVRDSDGKPLENAVVAVGIGDVKAIHTPIATALTDATGYYKLSLPEGTYIVEAFKGPGKFDTWIRDPQGRVLDYAEKIKYLLELYSDRTMDFTLKTTLAPEPPAVTRDYYWDERSVWIFPFAWGGYSLRDGTATAKPQVIECLSELRKQIPNINTVDVRLSIAPHPTVPDMPIISEQRHPVTMEDIEAITKEAHKLGLKVHLAIVGYGGIKVTDPSKWFANYLNLLLHPTAEQQQAEGVIEMCKRLGIEEFTLGWEFWGARREFEEGEWNDYWSNVVDQIRASGYTGKLCYHFQTINDPNGYWGPPVDKFCRLNNWIKKLDFIAMSDFHIQTYPPYNVDAPYDEALRSWYQHPDFMEGYGTIPILKTVYDTFKVPIVVNYGFRLRWGSCRTYGVPDLPKDEHAQAILYKASFEALAGKEWCHGVNLEHFDVPYGPANPTSCIRDEYSTQIINAGLASHSFPGVVPPPPKPIYERHTLLWLFIHVYMKGLTTIRRSWPFIDEYDRFMTARGFGVPVKGAE